MNNNGENQNSVTEPVLTPVNSGVTTNGTVAQSVSAASTATQQTVTQVTQNPSVTQNATAVQTNVNPVQSASTPVVSSSTTSTPPVQNDVFQPQLTNSTNTASESVSTQNRDIRLDNSYKASSSNLNGFEQPLNQDNNYSPSLDDMKLSDDVEPIVIKKKSKIVPLLFLIILGLGGYLLYITKDYHNKLETMKYNCTPVTSYKDEKELDINSTLVQDLYNKVHTSIREDVAQPVWDDNMKRYLAYRQISEYDKYESNCNLYDPAGMEPYTCVESSTYMPRAFKASLLELELKKLFVEDTLIPLGNIKLSNACVGGYEYIAERGEFVEGVCDTQTATSFKVDKQLSKAVSYRNTIILTENVKYHANEKMNLPDYLKSGEYIYTFRLDMNYNYVLIDKSYNDKYN